MVWIGHLRLVRIRSGVQSLRGHIQVRLFKSLLKVADDVSKVNSAVSIGQVLTTGIRSVLFLIFDMNFEGVVNTGTVTRTPSLFRWYSPRSLTSGRA